MPEKSASMLVQGLLRHLFNGRYNKTMTPDYEIYLSPYTWRYGSAKMRALWSEAEKRRVWRRLWVALAEVQAEFGLVSSEQTADLRKHMLNVDMTRALQIEAEIQHDLMAEVKTFAEQAILGGDPALGAPRWISGQRGSALACEALI
jgi:hypothetical protein